MPRIAAVNEVDTNSAGAGSDLTGKSLLTLGGLAVASGTIVSGGAVLTCMLPGPMLGAVTLTGGLLYAGHRKEQGKPLFGNGEKDTAEAVSA